MQRREFLKKTGTFLWQTSIYSLLLSQGNLFEAKAEQFADPNDPRLILLKSLKGPVLLPNDKRYSAKAIVHNIRLKDIHPTVIALCANESDIVKSLAWAKKYSVPFRVRSGGHSYEAYSTCNGLVIDLNLMNAVELNTSAATVRVGAGARLGQIYQTVTAQGYAIVGGSCPFVGIGGLTQGGGFGMLSRKFGLVIDNLLSARLITASGEILDVNENQNADLFWALRGGGGGNFGVVSEFTFKMHPLKSVSLFKISWPKEKAAEAFLTWQNWTSTLPDELTCHFTLAGSHNGISGAHAGGQFVGSTAQLNSIIAPLQKVISGTQVKTWEVPFINAIKYFSGGDTGASELFKAKSDYTNRAWTASEVNTIFRNIVSPGNQGLAMVFDHYGGAINRVASNATAFPHRENIQFCIQYMAFWQNETSNKTRTDWLNSFVESMGPYVTGGSYSNYTDADRVNWAESYYGANLERLIDIKAKVDPERFFDFPQAIPATRG